MMNQEQQPDMSHPFKAQARALIPTEAGDFIVTAYADDPSESMPHLVIAHPDALKQDVVTLRIHSECVTGDIFSSKRCDCGEQLARGLMIARRDKGMVIYLRQEGRGIGLINKLKAYNLQDQGFNTFDANEHLGFEADARQYDMALAMLDDLGVKKIRLLTNNPEKLDAFEGSSVDLVEHLPIIIDPNDVNLNYLKTKQDVMGHLLKIED